MDFESKDQNIFELLRAQLNLDYESFRSHYRELADYFAPRRGRFFTNDVNRGDKRNKYVIDPTGYLAGRTLASGMMSGITSPARPWFKLSTGDFSLDESANVKRYLSKSQEIMSAVFTKSNLYNALPIVYKDMGVFGTGCMYMEEDDETILRFYPYPAGSYRIANDNKMRVRYFFREFQLTVQQIVDEFGKDKVTGKIDWTNISDQLRSLYENNTRQVWYTLVHAIIPNEKYIPDSPISKHKKFVSVYYEYGYSGGSIGSSNFLSGIPPLGSYLRVSGYDYFPVLAPRWETAAEYAYGTDSPGMLSLGDVKQLQLGEKRSNQALDKTVNPPMVGHTALRNQKVSLLPGDITYVDEKEGLKGFRSAHDINFNIQGAEGKQDQVRQRINRSFFVDLFLQLTLSDRRQITAREIDERHDEKLLALGPVLEQLNQDLLDPLIENTYLILNEKRLLPEPPEELQGRELKIEYISTMAQAQKLVSIGSVDRLSSFAFQVSQVDPNARDKINTDELIDVYSDLLGAPPSLIFSDEEVAEIRQKRAQAQSQAQAKVDQQAQIENASKLGGIDMGEENALKQLIDSAQGL